MDDLKVKLPVSRIENENSAVDGLSGKISLECLVDRHSVNVGVVYEPYDLV